MHLSAYAHMQLCVETYMPKDRTYDVLDLGSRVSSRGAALTHRDLLSGHRCSVTGVDLKPGRNVDVVMTKPYRLPVKSRTQDVVITGQVFEHIPFFWASLLEVARVLRPGGYLFLTVPSRGHVHSHYDCWRYYPDSMRAMAAFAALELCEAHTDFPPMGDNRRHDYAGIDAEKHYWGDTVGVFRKPSTYPNLPMAVVRAVVVWWANRVGDLDRVPAPPDVEARQNVG